MTDKHTPGPWKLVKCPCGHPSCTTYGIEPGLFNTGNGFTLPDARLVVAAPDMLKALKALMEARLGSYAHWDAVLIAREVITKAETGRPFP
jgi:hypothetical protein